MVVALGQKVVCGAWARAVVSPLQLVAAGTRIILHDASQRGHDRIASQLPTLVDAQRSATRVSPRYTVNELLERTLMLSFDRLGSGGQMLPFALVVREGDTTECLTIVAERSDKAAYFGRRLVKERASTALEYAIATDAYVRRDGERLDAVIVEMGKRGEAIAQVVAQPYRVSDGAAERVGAPLSLASRPSELSDWDPHSSDWGAITPDIYNDARKLGVHIVNHNLELDENVERTIRFLRARIRHHARCLPAGSSQLVHYDDRGQSVTASARTLLVTGLGEDVEVRFSSAGNG